MPPRPSVLIADAYSEYGEFSGSHSPGLLDSPSCLTPSCCFCAQAQLQSTQVEVAVKEARHRAVISDTSISWSLGELRATSRSPERRRRASPAYQQQSPDHRHTEGVPLPPPRQQRSPPEAKDPHSAECSPAAKSSPALGRSPSPVRPSNSVHSPAARRNPYLDRLGLPQDYSVRLALQPTLEK